MAHVVVHFVVHFSVFLFFIFGIPSICSMSGSSLLLNPLLFNTTEVCFVNQMMLLVVNRIIPEESQRYRRTIVN